MTNLVDAEGVVRAWLRAQAKISALLVDRVYFTMPEQDRPALPMATFVRVGGGIDYCGHDNARVIVECWGVTKHDAAELARVVAESMIDAVPGAYANGYVSGVGDVVGPLPRTGTSWAKRYIVEGTFSVRNTV